MAGMPVTLRSTDVAIRLGMTIIAGLLVGYNRSEHGKVAGMRTTLMVCLAASVAMIQVNLLLPTAGRKPDSFVMNDLMRLPLGILTGVGFIGGGAILRRGDIVVGVTTAATLWLVTVIGLCLGGGQLALGSVATVLGLFALWVLKWFEGMLAHEHRATLVIELDVNGPGDAEIRRRLLDAGLSIVGSRVSVAHAGEHRELVFNLREMRNPAQTEAPAFIKPLAKEAGVLHLQWHAPG
jgi:putative Mg2+ transporter-C (MgtC) family protein